VVPPQLHVHGPEPATDDAVPVEQRLVEGADDTVVPFADPHAPFTAAGVGVGEGFAEPEVPKSKALPLANTAKSNRNSFIENRVIGGMISCRSQFYHSRLLRTEGLSGASRKS
jgi:hypothetical protein